MYCFCVCDECSIRVRVNTLQKFRWRKSSSRHGTDIPCSQTLKFSFDFSIKFACLERAGSDSRPNFFYCKHSAITAMYKV